MGYKVYRNESIQMQVRRHILIHTDMFLFFVLYCIFFRSQIWFWQCIFLYTLKKLSSKLGLLFSIQYKYCGRKNEQANIA